MARILNNLIYQKSLSQCSKGKHKFRENKFGVTWCVRCGQLSTSVGTSQILNEDDKIIITDKND